MVQATFAMLLLSTSSDHRNLDQRDSMVVMQPFGRMKADSQKLTVLNMTVLSNCSLPEKDKSLTDQAWKLILSLVKRVHTKFLGFKL